MTTYQQLLDEAKHAGIYVYERPMVGRNKGFYADGVIWLSSNTDTNERKCLLAEEIGHYETSSGNILDQSDIRNRKQEKRARQWAHQRLIPLPRIVRAYKAGVRGRYEIAEFLEVTEQFLQECIDRYTEKYGLITKVDNHHYVCFDPLGVLTIFE